MAVRTIRVGADSLHETLDGRQIPVVSRQRQIQAAADFITLVDVTGGNFSVLPARVRTGLPGEMVTTELLFHWRDRADAKHQYEEQVRFEPETGLAIHGEHEEPVQESAEDDGVDVEYVSGPDAEVPDHAEAAVAA